jgi:hypothetical protein
MLSVKECRRILKENGYEKIDEITDEEVLELRHLLYQWAELQIENEGKMCSKQVAPK